MRECRYYVKCRECGWEGYTLLRGYENGYLYLKCENCNARNLYLKPPARKDIIFIGGTALQDFTYFIKMTARSSWTWISEQPMLKKLTLGGGIFTALILLLCLTIFKEYSLHILIVTLGTITSTIALALRKGE